MNTKLFSQVLAVGLALLVVIGVGGVAAARLADYVLPADPANPIVDRGCVIRFDELSATGASVVPRIHANETHYCVGVTSVTADWTAGSTYGDLRINNTGGPGVILSMYVEEDETLTQLGIRCGPSGGGTLTRVRCYDLEGNKVPVQSLDMYSPNANLWVGWTMWMES